MMSISINYLKRENTDYFCHNKPVVNRRSRCSTTQAPQSVLKMQLKRLLTLRFQIKKNIYFFPYRELLIIFDKNSNFENNFKKNIA